MDTNRPPRMVVCAAIVNKRNGVIICGARHYDPIMRQSLGVLIGLAAWREADQGFIDQHGVFMDRKEAWKVAEAAGQIRRQVSAPGTLYSENLY